MTVPSVVSTLSGTDANIIVPAAAQEGDRAIVFFVTSDFLQQTDVTSPAGWRLEALVHGSGGSTTLIYTHLLAAADIDEDANFSPVFSWTISGNVVFGLVVVRGVPTSGWRSSYALGHS